MEQTFKSVDRAHLLKAFTLAHRCACNPDLHDKERKYFRAIAFELWQSCGEVGTITAQEAEERGANWYKEASRG